MAYTITLVGCKGDEIELIAMCMELCGLGISEASAIVDHMPSILFESISEDSANKYKKMLESAGGILKIDETQAVSPVQPDPDDPFPTPDFGKVMAGVMQSQPEPVQDYAPVSEPEPVPEPVFEEIPPESEPEPEPEPAPEPEPEKPARQSVVEIAPRSGVSESVSSQTQPSPKQQSASEQETSNEGSKYEYYGYCPKCGSSFVTVKKVGGLFGSNKVKCVCEACKHKF